MEEKKKLISKIFVVLLAFCFLIALFTVINVAAISPSDGNFKSEEREETSFCEDAGTTYVSLEEGKVHFQRDEKILVAYYVNSEATISGARYTQDGFSNVSITVDTDNPNRIIVEVVCDTDVEVHFLSIKIELSDENDKTAMLHVITNEYGAFISPFSADDARQKYFDYAREANIMTEDEYKEIKAKLSRVGAVEEEIILMPDESSSDSTTASTASPDTYVKGTLKWVDDNGNSHPLRRVIVKVYDDQATGERCLATLYTDHDGKYSYAFENPDGFWDFENGGYDIFIRVYAATYNATVINGSGEDYYYESPVSENVKTGSTTIKNLNIGMSTDTGRAFQISQAIVTARDYAKNMMGRAPEDVKVRYPYGNNCNYKRQSKEIAITGNDRENKYVPESYASWDAIMHEYGHHISYQMDIINSPGGDHSPDDNLADARGNKSAGIRLAWSEAWATIFGMQAQNYYKSYLSNIVGINDGTYDAYGFLEPYAIENNEDCNGEACEGSIMAILWDLYDDASDANDTISLGYTRYWALTTGNHSKTFSEFINYFYEQCPAYIDAIAPNLTYYNMASRNPVISADSYTSQDTPPTFSWVAQGGSESYPNNRFILIFYDSTNTEILRTAPTSSTKYTLSRSEWNTVLYGYGKTYTAAVAAMQTNEPVTGEYISRRSISYRKPEPSNLSKTIKVIASDRYKEDTVNLQPGQYIEYHTTFSVAGIKLIQTFGSSDVKIYLYDSERNLIAHNDDSGFFSNALLSCSVEANVTYILRVQFCSDARSGKIKTGIAPISTAYSNYEDIYNSKESPATYNFSSSLNTVAVMTYTPKESGKYKFTTNYIGDTVIDTCLYVVDPYSTDSSLYDDNSAGNMQATISTELVAGRTYFIVVSPVVIASVSGSMTLTVTKI